MWIIRFVCQYIYNLVFGLIWWKYQSILCHIYTLLDSISISSNEFLIKFRPKKYFSFVIFKSFHTKNDYEIDFKWLWNNSISSAKFKKFPFILADFVRISSLFLLIVRFHTWIYTITTEIKADQKVAHKRMSVRGRNQGRNLEEKIVVCFVSAIWKIGKKNNSKSQ